MFSAHVLHLNHEPVVMWKTAVHGSLYDLTYTKPSMLCAGIIFMGKIMSSM